MFCNFTCLLDRRCQQNNNLCNIKKIIGHDISCPIITAINYWQLTSIITTEYAYAFYQYNRGKKILSISQHELGGGACIYEQLDVQTKGFIETFYIIRF